jgi:hypothetical protein
MLVSVNHGRCRGSTAQHTIWRDTVRRHWLPRRRPQAQRAPFQLLVSDP